MRGRGGQASSCLNWWVLRTSPLKLTSQIREPGRAQYSSAGWPWSKPLLWGKKQAPYSPSRSLFPIRQNFSLKTSTLMNKEISVSAWKQSVVLTSLCRRGSNDSGKTLTGGHLGSQAEPPWSPPWWRSEQERWRMGPGHKKACIQTFTGFSQTGVQALPCLLWKILHVEMTLCRQSRPQTLGGCWCPSRGWWPRDHGAPRTCWLFLDGPSAPAAAPTPPPGPDWSRQSKEGGKKRKPTEKSKRT